MYRRPAFPLILFAAIAMPADAQNTVVQPENVRTEYAQVLRAEPVYQTLRATSMVEQCDQSTPVSDGEEGGKRGVSRILGAVKDVFTPESDAQKDADAKQADKRGRTCRMVPVNKEFRRPIAFDVDYVHHGIKYRSRLPYDPGNRLRVRVSVSPIVTPTGSN